MATYNLGRFIMIAKGSYSSSTTYNKLDVVLYNGSSYVCKSDNVTNKVPTNTTYWQLIAQAGQATMTEQQKQEIIAAILAQGVVIDPDYNTYSTEEKTKLAGLSNANNGTLTINCNGGRLGTFTANQASNSTITIPDITPVGDAQIILWDRTNDVLIDKFSVNQKEDQTIYIPVGSGGGSANNGQLTITHNGNTLGTFTANQATNTTITIPTINNATLTIKQNNTTVGTFTANASSNANINITVPTSVNDLNDGSDYAPLRGYTSNDYNTTNDVLDDVCDIAKVKANYVYYCSNATDLKISAFDYDATKPDCYTQPVTYIYVETAAAFTVDLTNIPSGYKEIRTGGGLSFGANETWLITVLGNSFKGEQLT